MNIKEWLELGKPENVKFVIERETDLLKIKHNPDYIFVMADLILKALRYYTDNQFVIEKMTLPLTITDNFDYEGYPFSAVTSHGVLYIGVLAYKLSEPMFEKI